MKAQQLEAEYLKFKQEASFSGGPSANNRASTIGHPCTAYCYFDRVTLAGQRKPVSERLAMVFAEGRSHERLLQIDLQGMGYDVSHQQTSLYWQGPDISGHQDFILSKQGTFHMPCELKSCSLFIWNSLHTAEDVRDYRWFIVQKWYDQIVLYAKMRQAREYWLVLKNKQTGAIKIIVFRWNAAMEQRAEELASKARTINRLVAKFRKDKSFKIKESLKIRQPKICAECDFFGVCRPRLKLGPGVKVLANAEVEAKLDRRAKIEDHADEFKALDEELKEYFRAIAGKVEEVVCGDWIASLSRSTRGKGKEKKEIVRVEFTKIEKGKT